MSWGMFVKEIWSCFGLIDCEDFDESLSKIQQMGSLRDYQKEFERLGNRMQSWTPKALMGTFMGGLKREIADGIKMFKAKTLKEANSLTRMQDDQLNRQGMRPASKFNVKPASSMKQLLWDEMRQRRIQHLCFNCDLLQGIDVKGHNYYYWREVKRVNKGPMMIQRIHFMLSRDQLNLQKLKNLFINLNLEDKVPLNENGNDG